MYCDALYHVAPSPTPQLASNTCTHLFRAGSCGQRDAAGIPSAKKSAAAGRRAIVWQAANAVREKDKLEDFVGLEDGSNMFE